jgi:protein phosphatase
LLDDPKLLVSLCAAVKEELVKEPHVVEVRGPSRLFGDIHGQLLDLLQFFLLYGSPDHYLGSRDVTHVFLGDFVDRGFYSLEVLMLLFSLKILNPSSIVLVRGNHESRSMSWQFGFREELEAKLGTALAMTYFEMFNDVFDNMPLACLVGEGRILCMHGGLGPNTETIAQINQVPKPLKSALKAEEDQVWTNCKNVSRVFFFLVFPSGCA